jgi:DNA polymerase
VTTASDDPRQRQKAVLDALIKACRQCDRPDRLNVPGVTESAPGYGSVYSPAAIVGEALCRAYMEKQEPFYGGSGRVLDRCYKRAGFDPTDLFTTNSIHCHPPDDRDTHMRAGTACHSCALSCKKSSNRAW